MKGRGPSSLLHLLSAVMLLELFPIYRQKLLSVSTHLPVFQQTPPHPHPPLQVIPRESQRPLSGLPNNIFLFHLFSSLVDIERFSDRYREKQTEGLEWQPGDYYHNYMNYFRIFIIYYNYIHIRHYYQGYILMHTMFNFFFCLTADWRLFPNELKIKVKKHRIPNSASKKHLVTGVVLISSATLYVILVLANKSTTNLLICFIFCGRTKNSKAR